MLECSCEGISIMWHGSEVRHTQTHSVWICMYAQMRVMVAGEALHTLCLPLHA